MAATAEIQSLSGEGSIVIPTLRQVAEHGAYVVLDDYNNMTGFLHISEIATGWMRNFAGYIRPKQKAVLKVIKINKARREVEKTGSNIEKQHGTFNFVRQESKKLHQLV
jgi:translation initiation factor 2 subunit 1